VSIEHTIGITPFIVKIWHYFLNRTYIPRFKTTTPNYCFFFAQKTKNQALSTNYFSLKKISIYSFKFASHRFLNYHAIHENQEKERFFTLLIVFLILIAIGFFEEILFYSKQSKSFN
jgi:hypothetical protein